MLTSRLRGIRSLVAIGAMVCLGGCLDGEGQIAGVTQQSKTEITDARSINVMTRNLYLGANLDPILALQNPNAVPFAIADAWHAVVASNFPERAEALADEIATSLPHLIGLQEATVYRRQSPSDYVLGNRTANASTVVYDFVDILLRALQARGLDYHVVARVQNNDLEFPMFTGVGVLPFDDIRYTDQDVILARTDVEISNPFASNFAAGVPLAIGGVPVRLLRGWVTVDATINGQPIRFANTHLEVQSFAAVQEAQARELANWLDSSPHTVILVGDFNSAANDDAPAASLTGSYGALLAAGYFDLWRRGQGQDAGLTCCHASDLRNAQPTLNQRIDLIFVNQRANVFVGGAQLDVLGDHPDDRTASGLWPSDHAGVVARIHLPAGARW